MRKVLLVLTITLAMLALAGSEAPVRAADDAKFFICWSTLPFTDILVHNYAFDLGNQFEGVGQDLTGSRTQHVSAIVHPFDGPNGTVTIGYTTLPRGSFRPVFASFTVDLVTLTGPGVCHSPDLAGCGSFTAAPIACPSGAFVAPENRGPVQGQ